MIEVKQVSKFFEQHAVVEEASACFEKGKVTAMIGPNGAGKSTLLAMTGRLLEKDAGEVWIDGQELASWDTKALAKRLSVLRQANSFTLRFTVRELVAFGRFPHSQGRLTTEDNQVIDKAIDYLDLAPLCDKYLDELSGGQRQLAFIAMVIAQDTDYVFLDEPLNNLDIKHSLQIMRRIKQLTHELNKAVVIVIHDINFASCYADTIVALKHGKIAAMGTVNEVLNADVLESIYETPFKVIDVDNKKVCLYC